MLAFISRQVEAVLSQSLHSAPNRDPENLYLLRIHTEHTAPLLGEAAAGPTGAQW